MVVFNPQTGLVNRALEHQRLEGQHGYLLSERDEEFNHYGIVGRSRAMKRVFKAIGAVADTPATVLLSPAAASFDMFVDYAERGHTRWRGRRDTDFCVRVALDVSADAGAARAEFLDSIFELIGREITDILAAAEDGHVGHEQDGIDAVRQALAAGGDVNERGEWFMSKLNSLSRKYKFVTPYTSFLAAPRSLLRPRLIRPGDPVLRVRHRAPPDLPRGRDVLPGDRDLRRQCAPA